MFDELGLTYMMINGSENQALMFYELRSRTLRLPCRCTVVENLILDEADYLNPQSTQPALRGFIEEFSANCGFILTCNYVNRIIQHLSHGVQLMTLQSQKMKRKHYRVNSF